MAERENSDVLPSGNLPIKTKGKRRSEITGMHPLYHLPFFLAGLLALSRSHPPPELRENCRINSTIANSQHTWEDSPSLLIAPSNIDFAFRFYHMVTSENTRKNVFFSPVSISAALAMLSLGAGEQSQTQILEALGFNLTKLSVPDIHEGFRSLLCWLGSPLHKPDVHVGSALLLSQDLEVLPRFVNDTGEFYNAKVLRSDFNDRVHTTQLINDYVKKETCGKIKDLVSGLDSNIKMVLVNFIYFHGRWEKPFSPMEVYTGDFHVDERTTVKVPMMKQEQEHWYLHDRHVACSVLKMGYQGDAAAFFILPHQGKLRQVEQLLSPDMLARWNRLLQHRYFHRKVVLHLPKFSISKSYPLDQILPDLGFQNLFSPQADFSSITKQQKLQLSKSFHKVTLDVNEEGTVAAAATGSSFMFLSAQHKPRVLMFNRPFFLVISSNFTQTILFMGKVVDPTA